jgi:hypothetical protein
MLESEQTARRAANNVSVLASDEGDLIDVVIVAIDGSGWREPRKGKRPIFGRRRTVGDERTGALIRRPR